MSAASKDVEPLRNLTNDELAAIRDRQADRGIRGSGYTSVVECAGIADLAKATAAAYAKGGPIDLIDIVDHGRDGKMVLGADTLVESDGTSLLAGATLADTLRPVLAAQARVRLLGCKTALGPTGRRMLTRLNRLLGDRVLVHGTIEAVTPAAFEDGEFSQGPDLLFSSDAAFDSEAPNATTRQANLQRFYR